MAWNMSGLPGAVGVVEVFAAGPPDLTGSCATNDPAALIQREETRPTCPLQAVTLHSPKLSGRST
jgi:hypothetical protein